MKQSRTELPIRRRKESPRQPRRAGGRILPATEMESICVGRANKQRCLNCTSRSRYERPDELADMLHMFYLHIVVED